MGEGAVMAIEVKHVVPVKPEESPSTDDYGMPSLWIAFVGNHIRCWVTDKATAAKYAKEKGLLFSEFKATGEWVI
jgi:hypothetical protein